jgi:hypothetical protein
MLSEGTVSLSSLAYPAHRIIRPTNYLFPNFVGHHTSPPPGFFSLYIYGWGLIELTGGGLSKGAGGGRGQAINLPTPSAIERRARIKLNNESNFKN